MYARPLILFQIMEFVSTQMRYVALTKFNNLLTSQGVVSVDKGLLRCLINVLNVKAAQDSIPILLNASVLEKLSLSMVNVFHVEIINNMILSQEFVDARAQHSNQKLDNVFLVH